jgi:hypothetical protein
MRADPLKQQAKPEVLIAIIAVVVAGIVQVSVTSGPFSFWNVIIGIILLLILSTYPLTGTPGKKERIMIAAIWGFTIILTLGLFLQILYSFSLRYISWLPPLNQGEAPSGYYFSTWIMASFLSYVVLFSPRARKIFRKLLKKLHEVCK